MKIFYKIIVLFFVSGALYGGTSTVLEVKKVGEDKLIIPRPVEFAAPVVYEIFDVFEKKVEVDGQEILTHYVDSVYLIRYDEYDLVFDYIWDGQRKYLEKGYFLSPSGRFYKRSDAKIKHIVDQNSTSRGVFSIYGTAGLDLHVSYESTSVGFNSETYEDKPFGSDMGVSVSTGLQLWLRDYYLKTVVFSESKVNKLTVSATFGWVFAQYQEYFDLYAGLGFFPHQEPNNENYINPVYNLNAELGFILKSAFKEWNDNLLLDLAWRANLFSADTLDSTYSGLDSVWSLNVLYKLK